MGVDISTIYPDNRLNTLSGTELGPAGVKIAGSKGQRGSIRPAIKPAGTQPY